MKNEFIHSKDGKNLNDVDLFDFYQMLKTANVVLKRCVTTQCNTIIRWKIQNPKAKIKSKNTIDT